MNKIYIAGIDIGTTGAKASIFDLEGNNIASSYNEYPCTYPKPNWVEQDADLLVYSTMKSSKEAILKSKIKPSDIVSVSVSAQRCCGIFLDENEKILRPMISWQDNRTHIEIEDISKKISNSEYYKLTGYPNSSTWLLSKMLWIKKNEPDTWKRTKRVVQMHDYFLRALGAADYFVDYNDAGYFGTFDSEKYIWIKKIIDLFDIPESIFPIPKPSSTVVGEVSRKASENSGFAPGTIITIGAGDQCAGALGAGIIKKGMISISMGTAGAAVAFTDKHYRDPECRMLLTNHTIKGFWQIEGYQAAAAGVYRWFRDEFASLEKAFAIDAKTDVFQIINEKAAKIPPGSHGLLLLPYFASAGTPRYNSDARGVLIGLTFAHDKAAVARAFMEGITFDMKDMINAMLKTGTNINKARILGGPTKSELWNQIQADIYGMTVETLKITDATILGAAILGGVGAGVFGSIEEGVERMVKVDKKYEPDPKNHKIYSELYEIYCRTYESLDKSGVFHSISKLQR